MESFDVLVVGGGPAGSTVASCVAKGGASALVLEREEFPRFHIGESMLPQSMKVWKRIGVVEKLHAAFIPKYGARFLCCATGRSKTYSFDEAFDASVPHAYEVLRADFDQLLLQHSAELGAEVRHGWDVIGPITEDGVVVGAHARSPDGQTREIRARVVVDATGRDTLFASRLSTKSKLPFLDKTGFFTHFSDVERQSGREEGNIDIISYPHGWFWNIPFRGNLNSFGFVCSREWLKTRSPDETLDQFYDRTVESASWPKRLLANAKKKAPARAIADYSYRVSSYGGDGWVQVGDATGFIDPLFSTGAHLAFLSGERAANLILAGLKTGSAFPASTWTAYEKEIRSASELFAGAVQAFYIGDLAESIFAEPQRVVLRKTITSMLAGDVMGDDAPWRRFLRSHFPVQLNETPEPAAPGMRPVITDVRDLDEPS